MIEQNAFTIIFGIFVLFSCRDVFYGRSSHDADAELNKPSSSHLHHSSLGSKSVPDMAHIDNVPEITTVKIQYCHSCGYRQAFEEIGKMLSMQYPDIKVEGELHQPNWLRSQIVNLLFLTKIALLVMICFDINPFTRFQMETPRIWTYLSQNKVSASLMILFLASSIESNMMSTGAFEIFYNDMPIWSKIQTGRMPSAPELLQAIQTQRAFNSKVPLGQFVPPA